MSGLDEMTEPVDPLAEVRDARWLDQQHFAPLVEIVPRLITEGLSLIVGAPKVGKSWLVLAIALAVAQGSTVLGIPVDRRPVLYLALEDGNRRLQARMRRLMPDQPLPAGLEFLIRLPENYSVAQVVTAWLDRHPGGLVFVDTLGRARPAQEPGESAYAYDYRIGSELKAITDERPGAALCLVHHDRKAEASDFILAVNGSNGLAGSIDGALLIRRERAGTDAVLQVTGRDVVEGEYAATFADTVWSLQGDSLDEAAKRAAAVAAGLNKGDVAKRIIDYIVTNSSGTAKQVAEALDITDDLARQTLSRLARDHRLDRTDRGVYVLPAM